MSTSHAWAHRHWKLMRAARALSLGCASMTSASARHFHCGRIGKTSKFRRDGHANYRFCLVRIDTNATQQILAHRIFLWKLCQRFHSPRTSLHWGLTPGPSAHETEVFPLSYRGRWSICAFYNRPNCTSQFTKIARGLEFGRLRSSGGG